MSKRNKIKPKKKRSKVILFLVEGMSDILTLETSIERMVDEICGKSVVVKFTTMTGGGDSTANMNFNPKKIEEEITHNIEKATAEGEYIYPKQVVKMIQIVDMDGAFVNEERIHAREGIESKQENRTYFEDRIETDNRFATDMNLKRKRMNLEYLSQIDKFKFGSNSVEYSIYFFSTNLEHYLYGKQNFESRESDGGKTDQARKYSEKCSKEEGFFSNTMINGEWALDGMTYKESWDYIMERGANSLTRCSNINIMVDDLRNWCENFVNESEEA